MRKSISCFLAAVVSGLLFIVPASGTPQDDDPLLAHRLEIETSDRIKSQILDPLLGPGRSFAFVELDLGVKRVREARDKWGQGVARRVSQKVDSTRGVSDGEVNDENLFSGFGRDFFDDFSSRAAGANPRHPVKASTDTGKSFAGEDRRVTSGSQRLQESRQEMGVEERSSEVADL